MNEEHQDSILKWTFIWHTESDHKRAPLIRTESNEPV
jgi:hypothetical protein